MEELKGNVGEDPSEQSYKDFEDIIPGSMVFIGSASTANDSNVETFLRSRNEVNSITAKIDTRQTNNAETIDTDNNSGTIEENGVINIKESQKCDARDMLTCYKTDKRKNRLKRKHISPNYTPVNVTDCMDMGLDLMSLQRLNMIPYLDPRDFTSVILYLDENEKKMAYYKGFEYILYRQKYHCHKSVHCKATLEFTVNRTAIMRINKHTCKGDKTTFSKSNVSNDEGESVQTTSANISDQEVIKTNLSSLINSIETKVTSTDNRQKGQVQQTKVVKDITPVKVTDYIFPKLDLKGLQRLNLISDLNPHDSTSVIMYFDENKKKIAYYKGYEYVRQRQKFLCRNSVHCKARLHFTLKKTAVQEVGEHICNGDFNGKTISVNDLNSTQHENIVCIEDNPKGSKESYNDNTDYTARSDNTEAIYVYANKNNTNFCDKTEIKGNTSSVNNAVNMIGETILNTNNDAKFNQQTPGPSYIPVKFKYYLIGKRDVHKLNPQDDHAVFVYSEKAKPQKQKLVYFKGNTYIDNDKKTLLYMCSRSLKCFAALKANHFKNGVCEVGTHSCDRDSETDIGNLRREFLRHCGSNSSGRYRKIRSKTTIDSTNVLENGPIKPKSDLLGSGSELDTIKPLFSEESFEDVKPEDIKFETDTSKISLEDYNVKIDDDQIIGADISVKMESNENVKSNDSESFDDITSDITKFTHCINERNAINFEDVNPEEIRFETDITKINLEDSNPKIADDRITGADISVKLEINESIENDGCESFDDITSDFTKFTQCKSERNAINFVDVNPEEIRFETNITKINLEDSNPKIDDDRITGANISVKLEINESVKNDDSESFDDITPDLTKFIQFKSERHAINFEDVHPEEIRFETDITKISLEDSKSKIDDDQITGADISVKLEINESVKSDDSELFDDVHMAATEFSECKNVGQESTPVGTGKISSLINEEHVTGIPSDSYENNVTEMNGNTLCDIDCVQNGVPITSAAIIENNVTEMNGTILCDFDCVQNDVPTKSAAIIKHQAKSILEPPFQILSTITDINTSKTHNKENTNVDFSPLQIKNSLNNESTYEDCQLDSNDSRTIKMYRDSKGKNFIYYRSRTYIDDSKALSMCSNFPCSAALKINFNTLSVSELGVHNCLATKLEVDQILSHNLVKPYKITHATSVHNVNQTEIESPKPSLKRKKKNVVKYTKRTESVGVKIQNYLLNPLEQVPRDEQNLYENVYTVSGGYPNIKFRDFIHRRTTRKCHFKDGEAVFYICNKFRDQKCSGALVMRDNKIIRYRNHFCSGKDNVKFPDDSNTLVIYFNVENACPELFYKGFTYWNTFLKKTKISSGSRWVCSKLQCNAMLQITSGKILELNEHCCISTNVVKKAQSDNNFVTHDDDANKSVTKNIPSEFFDSSIIPVMDKNGRHFIIHEGYVYFEMEGNLDPKAAWICLKQSKGCTGLLYIERGKVSSISKHCCHNKSNFEKSKAWKDEDKKWLYSISMYKRNRFPQYLMYTGYIYKYLRNQKWNCLYAGSESSCRGVLYRKDGKLITISKHTCRENRIDKKDNKYNDGEDINVHDDSNSLEQITGEILDVASVSVSADSSIFFAQKNGKVDDKIIKAEGQEHENTQHVKVGVGENLCYSAPFGGEKNFSMSSVSASYVKEEDFDFEMIDYDETVQKPAYMKTEVVEEENEIMDYNIQLFDPLRDSIVRVQDNDINTSEVATELFLQKTEQESANKNEFLNEKMECQLNVDNIKFESMENEIFSLDKNDKNSLIIIISDDDDC